MSDPDQALLDEPCVPTPLLFKRVSEARAYFNQCGLRLSSTPSKRFRNLELVDPASQTTFRFTTLAELMLWWPIKVAEALHEHECLARVATHFVDADAQERAQMKQWASDPEHHPWVETEWALIPKVRSGAFERLPVDWSRIGQRMASNGQLFVHHRYDAGAVFSNIEREEAAQREAAQLTETLDAVTRDRPRVRM